MAEPKTMFEATFDSIIHREMCDLIFEIQGVQNKLFNLENCGGNLAR